MISGPPLLDLLARATYSVKLMRYGLPHVNVDPVVALAFVRVGQFEGRVRAGKLRYVRELPERPGRPWEPCWRTTEAAVLQSMAATGEYSFS